jgi:hypothetical protein
LEIDEPSLAWFAGLFEGEGSFWFSLGRAKGLQITMTDLDVLEKVQSLVGGSISAADRRNKKDHWKEAYRWYLGNPQARVLTLKMFPYLLSRRQERATQYLETLEKQMISTSKRKKQSSDRRDMIKEMYASGEYTHQEIADILGTDRTYVSHVLRGRYD